MTRKRSSTTYQSQNLKYFLHSLTSFEYITIRATKIVLCNIRVNKKFSRRKIKNWALVSCSPMSCVSNETNPSSLALRIAMEFGKRQPLHFDR